MGILSTGVVWVPIFSMRSKSTGMFSVLKDGNFQLTLSRILASDFDSIDLIIPENVADIDQLETLIDAMGTGHRRITLVPMKYGESPLETRQSFYMKNKDLLLWLFKTNDLCITDIPGAGKDYPFPIPVVSNLNVTKIDGLPRPYVDNCWDLDSFSFQNSRFTTVLNQPQADYAASQIGDDKCIFVYTKVVNARYYELIDEVMKEPEDHYHLDDRTIFWPFRLSDTAYKFNEFLEVFEAAGLDKEYTILITDPNESYGTSTLQKPYVNYVKPSKYQYYQILKQKPIVVMLDDIDTVFHPGTAEFFYFGCKVITFENDLIRHQNSVSSIDEVPNAIKNISSEAVNIDNLVYGPDEVSILFNKNEILG